MTCLGLETHPRSLLSLKLFILSELHLRMTRNARNERLRGYVKELINRTTPAMIQAYITFLILTDSMAKKGRISNKASTGIWNILHALARVLIKSLFDGLMCVFISSTFLPIVIMYQQIFLRNYLFFFDHVVQNYDKFCTFVLLLEWKDGASELYKYKQIKLFVWMKIFLTNT